MAPLLLPTARPSGEPFIQAVTSLFSPPRQKTFRAQATLFTTEFRPGSGEQKSEMSCLFKKGGSLLYLTLKTVVFFNE